VAPHKIGKSLKTVGTVTTFVTTPVLSQLCNLLLVGGQIG